MGLDRAVLKTISVAMTFERNSLLTLPVTELMCIQISFTFLK